MKMVSCILISTLVASSCYLPKNYVDASPVPRYTAYPPQDTGSSAAVGVYNNVADLALSSSSSGLRPAIANRDQFLTDERPTATIPQVKRQQHQEEEGEEGYTSAMSPGIDVEIGPGRATVKQSALPRSAGVLAQMGSCGSMAAMTRTSLTAGATDGTALPVGTIITSYAVCPFSTTTGTVGARPSTVLRWRERGSWGSRQSDDDGPPYCNNLNAPVSSNDVQAPPAILLWMQCVLVAAEVLWIVVSKVRGWVSHAAAISKVRSWVPHSAAISKVRSWVSHSAAISKVRSWVSQCAGPTAKNEEPDRQESRARGDAPGDGDGIASPPIFGTRMAAWTSPPSPPRPG